MKHYSRRLPVLASVVFRSTSDSHVDVDVAAHLLREILLRPNISARVFQGLGKVRVMYAGKGPVQAGADRIEVFQMNSSSWEECLMVPTCKLTL